MKAELGQGSAPAGQLGAGETASTEATASPDATAVPQNQEKEA
jgi:phage shock protein A